MFNYVHWAYRGIYFRLFPRTADNNMSQFEFDWQAPGGKVFTSAIGLLTQQSQHQTQNANCGPQGRRAICSLANDNNYCNMSH
jgi:hypothetical protein